MSVDFVKVNPTIALDGWGVVISWSYEMAENESLVLGKSARWQRVLRAVRDGEPSEEVARKACTSLRRTIQELRKLLPFKEFVNSWNDPIALAELVRHCSKGRELANLFQMVARSGTTTTEETLRAFFGSICDRYLRQIGDNWSPTEQWTNLSDLEQRLSQIREMTEPEVARYARKTAENPDWQPRTRRSRSSSSPTEELMEESLLPIQHR